RKADVRIINDRIAAIGNLAPKPGERVILAPNRIVAPGFIDTHSHVDDQILQMPAAESAVRQGITTAICGQDGDSPYPLKRFFAKLAAKPASINIAMFAGHGTVRKQVMKADFKRAATNDEITRMSSLLDAELASGALGLSSGLEYDPGHYATTEE